jgi:hypothetical protein
MNKILIISTFLLLLNSCNDKVEKYQYYKFRKQITPSGKYVIYNYARYGSMASSSDISSTELFSIDKKFEEGKGIKIQGEISQWLDNDTLLVYDFKSELNQPKDTLPIKTTYKNVGDFTVKSINYKTNSGGTNRYTFDTVWTSSDKIYVRFNYSKKRKNTRSFPLGSVSIKAKNDSIEFIEIFGELSKDMNFTYKNADGTFSKNLPGIGTTYYEYKPTKKISAKNLSKKKIFWEE